MFRLVNNLKTGVLLAALMGLFVGVGYAIGREQGMIYALILGGAMNFFAYFYSDKLALAMMRAKPLDEREAPDVYRIVRDLTHKAGLPMPRVYLAPTAAPNAFATGRNPKKAVVCLTQGIMETLNRRELSGVIAHELAHVKHYDVLISSIAATIAGAIVLLARLVWFLPIGGDNRRGNPLGALALMILAPIAAMLIQLAISRRREYNADNYGAQLVGDPMPLAVALERLHAASRRVPMQLINQGQANMFIVEPFSGADLASWFATHPPVKKRVEKLIGRETTGWVR